MTATLNSISDPKLSLTILSDEEVSQLHNATLEVLDTVGVKFPSHKALNILESNGARVNRTEQIARIPPEMVAAALKSAPGDFLLAGLDPSFDLPLDGNHSYLATDGCGVEIIDAFSGERRRTTKADVSDVARVADFLDAIAFHWVAVSAQDCPAETRGLHELQAVWNVSRKHVQTESILNEREMHAAVEMASLLAGGSQALRERPVLSITQCTLSPLAHDRGSLEAGLIAAQAGMPVGFMEARKTTCSARPPTGWQISTTCLYPWGHLPQARNSQIGKRRSITVCPPLWQFLLFRTCYWEQDSLTVPALCLTRCCSWMQKFGAF